MSLSQENSQLVASIVEWEEKLALAQSKLKETEREHAITLKQAIESEREKFHKESAK